MKQTNWTQMLNRKSTNTTLQLRNCVSKNSLKTLFKINVQAKIGVFVLFCIKDLGPICLLHDAKIRSSECIFVMAIGFF